MNTNVSIYNFLKGSSTQKDAVKMIYYDRYITFGELVSDINNTSGLLQAQGVKKGDAVGIILPNMPEGIIALYAINNAGGIANLIHPKISARGLVKILETTKTKVVFLYDALYKIHSKRLKDMGITVILCSLSNYMKKGIKKTFLSLIEPRLKGKAIPFSSIKKGFSYQEVSVLPEDNAVYIHSGGTTGQPKTVIHNNKSLNSLSNAIIKTVYQNGESYKPSDSMLMMLPMFHGFGLGVSTHTILSYLHIVIMPKFTGREANKLIKKHKITHLAGVPSMYKKMMDHHGSFRGDFSSLTHIFCGGDTLSLALKKEFDSKLKSLGSKAEILEGYGLSETASVFSLSRNGEVRDKSQGQPLIGNRVRVVDQKGRDIKAGEEGELLLNTPSMMVGYLQNGTGQTILVDENGDKWLKTGDIGKVDEDGYIYFRERAKRTIKISGINIFPSEIEEVVSSLPEVKECCVARYSINGKPYTKLYVVVHKKFKFNTQLENKIKSKISKNLIKYALPKEIVPVETLYRTSLGKVDYLRYEKEIKNLL